MSFITALFLAAAPNVLWTHGATKQPAEPVAEFHSERQEESLLRIMQTGRYRGVDLLYHEDRKVYEIVLWEKLRIQSVSFTKTPEGVEAVFAKLVDTYLGKEYTSARTSQLQSTIEKLLREHGYFQSEVVVLVQPSQEGSTISYSVDVKEGRRCVLSAIQTNVRDPDLEAVVLDLLGIKAGRPVNTRVMRDAVTNFPTKAAKFNYLRPRVKNYKLQVSPDKSQATLHVEFDKIRILEFQYSGELGVMTPSELTGVIQPSLDRALSINDIAETVLKHYRSRGYTNAEVRSREYPTQKPGTDRIEIIVKSGVRMRLDALEWQGFQSLDADEMSAFLKKFGPETLERGIYSKEDFNKGVAQLETYFKNRGLFHARIQHVEEILNQSKDGVRLTITVYEGVPTRLRKLSFTGVNEELSALLLETSGLKEGDLVNLEALENFLNNLPETLKQQGYFYAVAGEALWPIDRMVTFSKAYDSADITVPINLGPKVWFGQSSVFGLKKTKHKVLLREIQWEPNTPFDSELVEETRFRLNRTGLFRSVRIEFNRQITDEEMKLDHVVVPIEFYVDERPAGLFETGVGVRSDDGFKAFGGVSYRNLAGMNRILSSRFEMNAKFPHQFEYVEPVINIGYVEPWLGRIPLSLRSNILFQKRDNFDRDKQSTELSNELQYAFTRHLSFRYMLYSIQASKSFNFRNEDGSIDRVRADAERTAVIGPSLQLDYRNDVFNPSKGWVVTSQFRYSDPNFGSDDDIRFLHVTSSVRFYFPLHQRLVFATYGGHGYVWALGETYNIAQDYLLKLGGRSSLRSYAQNSIGPSGKDVQLVRDSQLINTRAEFRISAYQELGWAVFWDGGTVLVNGEAFGKYRHSVGTGFRYKTPVGPIALDFAFGVDDEALPPGQKNRWRIDFSLGTF